MFISGLLGYKFVNTKYSAYLKIEDPIPTIFTFCMRVKADYAVDTAIPFFRIEYSGTDLFYVTGIFLYFY